LLIFSQAKIQIMVKQKSKKEKFYTIT